MGWLTPSRFAYRDRLDTWSQPPEVKRVRSGVMLSRSSVQMAATPVQGPGDLARQVRDFSPCQCWERANPVIASTPGSLVSRCWVGVVLQIQLCSRRNAGELPAQPRESDSRQTLRGSGSLGSDSIQDGVRGPRGWARGAKPEFQPPSHLRWDPGQVADSLGTLVPYLHERGNHSV